MLSDASVVAAPVSVEELSIGALEPRLHFSESVIGSIPLFPLAGDVASVAPEVEWHLARAADSVDVVIQDLERGTSWVARVGTGSRLALASAGIELSVGRTRYWLRIHRGSDIEDVGPLTFTVSLDGSVSSPELELRRTRARTTGESAFQLLEAPISPRLCHQLAPTSIEPLFPLPGEHVGRSPLVAWALFGEPARVEVVIQDRANTRTLRAELSPASSMCETGRQFDDGPVRFWLRAHYADRVDAIGPIDFVIATGCPNAPADLDERASAARGRRDRQRRVHEQELLQAEAVRVVRDDIKRGRTRLSGPPLGANIRFVGRGCNISCNMCSYPNNIEKQRFGNYYEKVMQTLKPMLGSMSLVQNAGAEPLMYPEFRELLEEGREWPNLKFGVATNGLLIDDGWADLFCASNVSKVSISLDAATPETYAGVRRRSDWERVMAGIRRVTARRRDSQSPPLCFSFIVFRHNLHEVDAFVSLAAELGAREVLYQVPLRVTDPRAMVAGTTTKQTKLEWTYENESYRDPLAAGEVIWRLERAREKAESLGLRIPYTNVNGFFLARHPYLKGIEHLPALDEVPSWISAAVQDGVDVYAPLPPVDVPAQLDPGTTIEWRNGTEYSSNRLWLVNLDRRIPPSRSCRVIAVACGQPERGASLDISGIVPDGEYDIFFVSEGSGDYAVSKRVRLNVVGAPATPWMPTAVGRGSQNVEDYGPVPDEVETSQRAGEGEFFCTHPFTNLTIRDGSYSFCCWSEPKYLGMPAGDGDVARIWNDDPIREARYHMLTGNGREHVCREICPHYQTGFRSTSLGSDGFEI